MGVRVYIATTEGPVRVERITREPAARSVVCLGRTTTVLPISDGYDAFTCQPSGVVERALGPFAPGAFRLDVDGPIGGGESWQLGAFAAHALAAAGKLAGAEARPERAIWLTGRVRDDLGVAPVDFVADKIRSSAGAFAGLAGAGVPLTLFVHPDNVDDIDAGALGENVEIVPVESVHALCRLLGLMAPGAVRAGGEVRRRRRHRTAAWLSAAAAAALLVAVPAGLIFGAGNGSGPAVDAGGPYTVDEGGAVTVAAVPGDGGLLYAWDLDGDGVFETTGRTARFDASAIDGPARKFIRLRAKDRYGGATIARTAVAVRNVAPAAPRILSRTPAAGNGAARPTAADPVRLVVDEGASIAISATGTDAAPADAATLRFAWDLDGDGAFETSGRTVRFDAAGIDGPAVVTIRVRVADDDGGASIATARVEIRNVAPGSVSIGAEASGPATPREAQRRAPAPAATRAEAEPESDETQAVSRVPETPGPAPEAPADATIVVDEGSTVTITASGSDAAPADAVGLLYAWDLDGDGVFETTGAAIRFDATAIDGPATRTLRLRVADDDGGATVAGAVIEIRNVAPRAGAGGPYAANEGGAVTLRASGGDAAPADRAGLRYAWDLDGDGRFETAGRTARFDASAIDGPATRTARVRVSDDDGGATIAAARIDIRNLAPVADAGGPYAVDEGAAVTLAASGRDAASADAARLRYAWDLDGDGVFEAKGRTARFDASGIDGPATRTVRVRIADDDGGATVAAARIAIRNVAPAKIVIRPQAAGYLSAPQLKAMFSGAVIDTVSARQAIPLRQWFYADGKFDAQALVGNHNILLSGEWRAEVPGALCYRYSPVGGDYRGEEDIFESVGGGSRQCIRVARRNGKYRRFGLDGKAIAGSWRIAKRSGQATRYLSAPQLRILFSGAVVDTESPNEAMPMRQWYAADGKFIANLTTLILNSSLVGDWWTKGRDTMCQRFYYPDAGPGYLINQSFVWDTSDCIRVLKTGSDFQRLRPDGTAIPGQWRIVKRGSLAEARAFLANPVAGNGADETDTAKPWPVSDLSRKAALRRFAGQWTARDGEWSLELDIAGGRVRGTVGCDWGNMAFTGDKTDSLPRSGVETAAVRGTIGADGRITADTSGDLEYRKFHGVFPRLDMWAGGRQELCGGAKFLLLPKGTGARPAAAGSRAALPPGRRYSGVWSASDGAWSIRLDIAGAQVRGEARCAEQNSGAFAYMHSNGVEASNAGSQAPVSGRIDASGRIEAAVAGPAMDYRRLRGTLSDLELPGGGHCGGARFILHKDQSLAHN